MIVIPEGIEALIFDLDGTLADTMPLHLASWREVGKELNVEINDALIFPLSGTPTVKIVAHLNEKYGWNLDPAEVTRIKRAAFARLKKENGKITPLKPIYEIAKSMRGKMPMSIGTGSSRKNALNALEDMEMTDWWEIVLTASDDIKGKPAPDIYIACAKAMGIDPSKCLVFEDGAAGIQSAIAAKMQYIDVKKYTLPNI